MKLGIPELLKLTADQLKQDTLGRAAFVCWMSAPPYLLLACWAVISVFAVPMNAPGNGLMLIALFGICAAMLMAVYGIASYHPKVADHPQLYTHVVLWTYCVLAVIVCYLLGSLNMLTGLVMMAAPTIGLVLFPVRLVAMVSLVSLVALLILSTLAALNIIPYAPGLGVKLTPSPGENLYLTASMIVAASGYVAYQAVILMVLISAWRTREDGVRVASATDPLTGVANRRHILERLESFVHGQQRREDRIALLMLDIDHFKEINDVHGHASGDEALMAVVKILGKCLRDQDLVGRYGGEEFLLVLPGTDQHEARDVAERCRQAIEACVLPSRQGDISLSVSIGVVSRILGDQSDIDELIRLADDAMYAAKRAGRNCVVVG